MSEGDVRVRGRVYRPFSREARTAARASSPPSGNGASAQDHRCPRCDHRWVEGPPGRLTWPGLALERLVEVGVVTPASRPTVAALLAACEEEATCEGVARRLGIDRRTLNRRTDAAGLPPPSKWIALGRMLGLAELMVERGMLLRNAARWLREDGFTASNRLDRELGLRPTELGGLEPPAWEHLLDRWLDGRAWDE